MDKTQRQLNKVKTVFYILATVVLILVIVGMLTDFISYKNAIGYIKHNLPQNAKILQEGGGTGYHPFRWRGDLTGRIYLSMTEDMTPHSYTNSDRKQVYGFLDGKIPSSGVTIDLQKVSDFPEFYGEGTVKSLNETHHIKIWVYLLKKGNKIYKRKFVGYQAVDYPITQAIIKRYLPTINTENDITQKDIDWLCTFTHDSLHKFVISFFKKREVPKLFTKPYIYAYRLDSIISSQNKFERIYKTYWTGKRTAALGIIYNEDGNTYVRVVYNAWYIGCHDGGYIFDFWK